MNNREKLIKVFSEALDIEVADVGSQLAYESHNKWDSTAHMELIALLEETFKVLFEMDDIIDMSSFDKSILILEKYGVQLS